MPNASSVRWYVLCITKVVTFSSIQHLFRLKNEQFNSIHFNTYMYTCSFPFRATTQEHYVRLQMPKQNDYWWPFSFWSSPGGFRSKSQFVDYILRSFYRNVHPRFDFILSICWKEYSISISFLIWIYQLLSDLRAFFFAVG